MFEDLRKSINDLKLKIKGIDKKVVLEEYLNLLKRKIELEAELNKKKSAYYAELAKIQDRKARKKTEHFKFLLGGLVLRDNPEILEKYISKEEIEKLNFKINYL